MYDVLCGILNAELVLINDPTCTLTSTLNTFLDGICHFTNIFNITIAFLEQSATGTMPRILIKAEHDQWTA